MKTTIITVLISVFAFNYHALNAGNNENFNSGNSADTVSVDDPASTGEEAAQFPGGDLALEKFVQKNIQYPRIAKEQGIEGRVIVSLTIDETGAISNIEVIQGIGGGCDEEVIRVLTEMPDWKPTKQAGHEVKAKKIFSFNFQL